RRATARHPRDRRGHRDRAPAHGRPRARLPPRPGVLLRAPRPPRRGRRAPRALPELVTARYDRASMPTLKLFTAAGAPRAHLVHKPVTTLGKGLGNDVALQGHGVAEHHAQIVFDDRDFLLEEVDRDADLAINGKK